MMLPDALSNGTWSSPTAAPATAAGGGGGGGGGGAHFDDNNNLIINDNVGDEAADAGGINKKRTRRLDDDDDGDNNPAAAAASEDDDDSMTEDTILEDDDDDDNDNDNGDEESNPPSSAEEDVAAAKKPRLQPPPPSSFTLPSATTTAEGATDGWGIPFGRDTWIRDATFLQQFAKECERNKTSWANFNYTGPSIRQICPGLNELCPCASPICASCARNQQGKLRKESSGSTAGGGKMFCFVRVLIDPEHIEPIHTRNKALSAFHHGLHVRQLAKTFLDTYQRKRSKYSWGETILESSGILERIRLVMEKGDASQLVAKTQQLHQFTLTGGGGLAGTSTEMFQAANMSNAQLLDELASACKVHKEEWAAMRHYSKALRTRFPRLPQVYFPCCDDKCTSCRGRAKMFCTIRFLADPGHIRPVERLKKVLQSFSYGTEIRQVATFFLERLEEKRASLKWGTTDLDRLGVTQAIREVSQTGDLSDLARQHGVSFASGPPGGGASTSEQLQLFHANAVAALHPPPPPPPPLDISLRRADGRRYGVVAAELGAAAAGISPGVAAAELGAAAAEDRLARIERTLVALATHLGVPHHMLQQQHLG